MRLVEHIDVAERLLAVWRAVEKRDLPPEQAITAAGNPQLVQQAVPGAIAELGVLLRRVSELTRTGDLSDDAVARFGYIVGTYASALGDSGRNQEAVELNSVLEPLFAEHGSQVDVATCRMNRANALQEMGEYQQAISGYDTAESLFVEHGSQVDVARCQMNRAIALCGMNKHQQAISGYDTAESLFVQHQQWVSVANCQMNRANALQKMGKYQQAISRYDTVEPLFVEHGSQVDVASCQMNRANALQKIGEYQQAISGYDAVESLFVQHQQWVSVASCQMNRANALKAVGKYQQAIDGYDTAEPLFVEHGSQVDVASCQMNRASALKEMGKYQQAIDGYDTAEPLFVEHGSQVDVANCQMNRANALQEMGKYQQAISGYDTAEPLFVQHQQWVSVANCQMNRANALFGMNKHQQAINGYDTAEPIFEQAISGYDTAESLFVEHGSQVDVANCQMNRASALKEMGKYQQAINEYGSAETTYREALAVYEQADVTLLGEDIRWMYHAGFGEALWRVEQRREALEQLSRGRHALRHARQTGGIDETSLEFVRERGGLVRSAVRYALEADQTGLAYQAVQDGKAGILGDLKHRNGSSLLVEQEGTKTTRAELCQWLRQGRLLFDIDNKHQTDLDHECLTEGLRRAFERQGVSLSQKATVAKRGSHWQISDQEHQRSYSIKERADEANGLRKKLNTLTIREHATDEQTLRQWATPYLRQCRLQRDSRHHSSNRHRELQGQTRAHLHDTPAEQVRLEEIQAALPEDWALLDFWVVDSERIKVFLVTRSQLEVETLSLKKAKDSKAFDEAFLDLNDWLVTGQAINVEPLELFYDLLFAPLKPALQGIKGLYLVPHEYLHFIPLHACCIDQGWYLGDEFAIAYLPSASLLPQLPPLSLNGKMLTLANPERLTDMTLPFSEWEAEEVQRRLQLSEHDTWIGANATLDKTKSWQQTPLVHFTGHGSGLPSFAALSHLRLADDLLLAHDVMYRQPPLPEGALAILNGCQTGVRDWTAVDEGLGLMSAFLLRGASLVLSTQWSVTDYCAAEMVITFLTELVLKGENPTDALRKAQGRARTITAEEEEARCQELLQFRFPPQDFPHEAEKLNREAMRACLKTGNLKGARHYASHAAHALRAVDRPEMANRVLAYPEQFEQPGVSLAKQPGALCYDHPVHWSAFHLVGRVT